MLQLPALPRRWQIPISTLPGCYGTFCMKMKLIHKSLLVVSILLLMEILLLCTFVWLLTEAEEERQMAQRSQAMVVEETFLNKLVYDAVASLTAFGLSHSEQHRERFNAALTAIPTCLESLQKIATTGSSEELQDVEETKKVLAYAVDVLKQCEARVDAGSPSGLRDLMVHYRKEIEMFVSHSARMVAKHKLSADADTLIFEKTKSTIRMVILIAFVFNVVGAILLAIIVNRQITSRLHVLTKNTVLLAQSKPLMAKGEGADEIAYLDQVFHEMAATLHEAKAKERAVVDNMPVGFVVTNEHGNIETTNPRLDILTQNTSNSMLGRNFQEFLFSPQDDTNHVTLPVLESRTHQRVEEFLLKFSSHRFLPVEISMNKLDIGGQTKLLFNVLDISERFEVERLKEEMMAMVSHDLRTPLTSIHAVLTLLPSELDLQPDNAGLLLLDRATAETERLIKLVNDLLDMARMESGKFELDIAPTDISAVLQRAVRTVQAIAEKKQQKLGIECALPEILADAERIIQVGINLLGNAIKFAPFGSAIRIVGTEYDTEIEIQVIDQGSGIAPEDRERIFKRFEQSGAKSLRQAGTGLGLSICRMIVEAHHGSIGVRSTLGEGSTFWFRLPKMQSEPKPVDSHPAV